VHRGERDIGAAVPVEVGEREAVDDALDGIEQDVLRPSRLGVAGASNHDTR